MVLALQGFLATTFRDIGVPWELASLPVQARSLGSAVASGAS
jgi:hypothetical protein